MTLLTSLITFLLILVRLESLGEVRAPHSTLGVTTRDQIFYPLSLQMKFGLLLMCKTDFNARNDIISSFLYRMTKFNSARLTPLRPSYMFVVGEVRIYTLFFEEPSKITTCIPESSNGSVIL